VIDVALTPRDLAPADVAVVIDVLRATSTATQALAAGYGLVRFADSIDRALTLRADGRVLAGERHCVAPPGFDQGNSPADAARRGGDEFVLATTNGAPAIVAAAEVAPRLLVACLLNLGAVIAELAASPPDLRIQIVCSGTNGAVALEDVYVAGRIAAGLSGDRSDAARVAEAVARAFPSALDALQASDDAEALRAAGLAADIAYCARESELDIVPAAIAAGPGLAVAVAG
jgi:2-phosphosulfolactate phosphatase